MAPRIGFIAVGHPDYPHDKGRVFCDEAMDALRSRGVLCIDDGRVYTDAPAASGRGQEMLGERLDGVVIWPCTWIEASTAIAALREFEHLPLALWGFGMYEEQGRRESTGSFVAGCVLKGTLERMGYRFRLLSGFGSEEPVVADALAFCRAANAFQRLKRTRLGLVGYASMSMYPGTFDHALLRRHIGPEVVHFDTYSLVRLAEEVPYTDLRALIIDLVGPAELDVEPERLAKSARLYGALRKLCDRYALNGINVKCQYELSQEWGMTPCVPLSRLADHGIVSACEGDIMVSATMCMMAWLSGQTVTYGDILDLHGDTMLLSACGFAPMSLAHSKAAPLVCELGYPGFDGIISSCVLAEGKVTFARLVEGVGDYRLVYGTGTGVDTDLRQGRFPALNVKLDGDPQRLLDTIASQHYGLCYGDLSAELEELCRIMGIEAVRV